MTAISSLSAGSVDPSSYRQSWFKKLDTDGDGEVTKAEFVAGRPKNVSEDQASSLFDKIDSGGTGEVNEQQFAAGMQQARPHHGGGGGGKGGGGCDPSASLGTPLSSDVLSALIQTLEQGTASSGNTDAAGDLFSQIDTNGDGSISKDEFVASLTPPAATSSGAATTSTDGTAATSAATSTDSTTASDDGSADDVLLQLLQAIASYSKNAAGNSASDTSIASLLSATG